MTLTTKEIDKTILFSFLYRTKYILSFYANEYSIHSWYDILRSKTLVERVNDTIRLTFLTGVRRCTKIVATMQIRLSGGSYVYIFTCDDTPESRKKEENKGGRTVAAFSFYGNLIEKERQLLY